MNPKVWILKEQPVRGALSTQVMDYSPAMEFGELTFVTDFDPPIHPNGQALDHWNKAVWSFVTEYNPERDFIIATGRADAIFTIGAVFGRAKAQFRAPVVKLLVWRREENRYRVRIFNPQLVVTAA